MSRSEREAIYASARPVENTAGAAASAGEGPPMSDFEPAGWEQWEWDESLFSGAAPYYVRGRPPYAPGIVDALAGALQLDGSGRLLDLGCGPGTVTLQLSHLFEQAVGLDPDPGMLRWAARLAARQAVRNVRWVRDRAESLPRGLGRFRLVTLAASFHWMDRPLVAGALATMLERDGAVAQLDAPGYRPDELLNVAETEALPHAAPPFGAIDRLRIAYLGPNRRAGKGVRDTSPSGEDEVFRSAGFLPAQTIRVPDGRILEPEVSDLIAWVLSSSWAAPHLFGARLLEFEADLRAVLLRHSPSGRFSIRLPDNVISVWRPAPSAQ